MDAAENTSPQKCSYFFFPILKVVFSFDRALRSPTMSVNIFSNHHHFVPIHSAHVSMFI
jgi:hypothetical protein